MHLGFPLITLKDEPLHLKAAPSEYVADIKIYLLNANALCNIFR